MAHIRTCERCRSVWARFAAISSALGISMLFALSELVRPSSAALAAAGDANASSTLQLGNDPASSTSGPQPPSTKTQAPTGGGLVSNIASRVADTAGRVGGALSSTPARIAVAAGGAAVMTAGAALLIAGVTAGKASIPEADAPTAAFAVAASISAAQTSFDIQFSVPGYDWQVQSLQFIVPPDSELVSAAPGWECTGASGAFSCSTTTANASGGSFVFGRDAAQAGEFSAAIEALADGVTVRGLAQGTLLAPTP